MWTEFLHKINSLAELDSQIEILKKRNFFEELILIGEFYQPIDPMKSLDIYYEVCKECRN